MIPVRWEVYFHQGRRRGMVPVLFAGSNDISRCLLPVHRITCGRWRRRWLHRARPQSPLPWRPTLRSCCPLPRRTGTGAAPGTSPSWTPSPASRCHLGFLRPQRLAPWPVPLGQQRLGPHWRTPHRRCWPYPMHHSSSNRARRRGCGQLHRRHRSKAHISTTRPRRRAGQATSSTHSHPCKLRMHLGRSKQECLCFLPLPCYPPYRDCSPLGAPQTAALQGATSQRAVGGLRSGRAMCWKSQQRLQLPLQLLRRLPPRARPRAPWVFLPRLSSRQQLRHPCCPCLRLCLRRCCLSSSRRHQSRRGRAEGPHHTIPMGTCRVHSSSRCLLRSCLTEALPLRLL